VRRPLLTFFFLLFSIPFFAQQKGTVHIDKSFNQFTPLFYGWFFHPGDSAQWSAREFDDSRWDTTGTLLMQMLGQGKNFKDIGWFRLHLQVDSFPEGQIYAMQIDQQGASEIFLDGKLVRKYGTVSATAEKEIKYNPRSENFGVTLSPGEHVIAIRYSKHSIPGEERQAFSPEELKIRGFVLMIGPFRQSLHRQQTILIIACSVFTLYLTFFLTLCFVHTLLYLYYKKNRSNLYYAIFCFGFSFVFLSLLSNQAFPNHPWTKIIGYLNSYALDIYLIALLTLIYSLFYEKLPKIYWWIAGLALADEIMTICGVDFMAVGFLLMLVIVEETIRVAIRAIIKKQNGAWIIATGMIAFVLWFLVLGLMKVASKESVTFAASGSLWSYVVLVIVGLVTLYGSLSVPISMSVYLARNFSLTNKNLELKLAEVETLSEKSIAQEKEKQKILETQKEMLEEQVKERTTEVVSQKKLIEEKNKDITDSINYAKRIQDAMLPAKELKYRIFPDAFVLFKPKDIVSGDFYWFTEKHGKRVIAAADCTGHGVPGALMSMIGNNILDHIVNEKEILSAADILNHLHLEVRAALKQHEQTETKDGMDIAICVIGADNTVDFAGAQRPLWMIRNGNFEEIKGDKISIGGIQSEAERKFKSHVLSFAKGDSFYIFSDGYADQFGGKSGKKFMTKRLRELLLTVYHEPMSRQEQVFDEAIEKWKDGSLQVDDILVIGVRI
jgi:serine phosphatase RsbU (regulator of sigma subunit)